MDFLIRGHDKVNTVQTAIQIFYPNLTYHRVDAVPNKGMAVTSCLSDGIITSELYSDSSKISSFSMNGGVSEESLKRNIKYCIFEMLKKVIPLRAPWGIMTGIRPAKIVGSLYAQGMSYESILAYMQSYYGASSDKINLAIEVHKHEKEILSRNSGKDTGLYIGIPFCPTRCLYCSFTSYPANKYVKHINDYLDCLIKEMTYAKTFLKDRYLESIYIGGGTPTSISEYNLERLLENINYYFDIDNIKEFTVEAGRPDTITAEKLKVLKKNRASRISVNPQTLNNKTLKLIGRKHSAEDFVTAFALAREAGFKHINVDLILGLPEETTDDVKYTLEGVSRLQPESVTIHTLAVKRASRLKEELYSHVLASMDLMEEMLDIASVYMNQLHLKPYYMYKQKNSLGNFENVGYAKKGHESIYNVQIMEEKQTILALGAGAVSKFVNIDSGRIERAFNVKDVEGYLSRIDEMIQRKKDLENIV